MQVVSRILIFTLCINAFSFLAMAETVLPALQAPVSAEILEKQYVSLELAAQDSAGISILKTIGSLLKVLENKVYSLLNWRVYSRRVLEVESYDRIANFGRWINDPNDETCYNTRALVLMRDSAKPVTYRDTNKCSVESGHWKDPYTGKTFLANADMQIDHVVPLKNAYDSGAYKWSFRARCLYGNYLGLNVHLLSVNGSENMKKGDKSPERYMPPNSAYACTYLKNWLTIKFLWGMKMTVSEADGITALIKANHCDPRSFRISQKDIIAQAEFTRDNIDLCEKIDAARSESNTETPGAN